MRSRSLSEPGATGHVHTRGHARSRVHRTASDTVLARLARSTRFPAITTSQNKPRLIVISRAGAPLDTQTRDQLQNWESQLGEQGLRMLHAELGEEHDACLRLSELIAPHTDGRTQVVMLRTNSDHPASNSDEKAAAIRQHLQLAGIRLPAPIVVDEGSFVGGDIPPALLAAIDRGDAWSVDDPDERLFAFHDLVAMGDPFDTLPVALVVAKTEPLTDAERDLLEQLQRLMAPAPLLCLTLADPMTDLERLGTAVVPCLTPVTPTLILPSRSGQRGDAMLRHHLMVLAQGLHDEPGFAPTIDSTLCNPRLFDLTSVTSEDDLGALAKVTRIKWSSCVSWQDDRYLNGLVEWTSQPGNCSSAYPHAGMAFVRYIKRILEATRANPQAPIPIYLSLLGLGAMPPLPDTRCFETVILTACSFSDLSNLPTGIRVLRLRSAGLKDVKLDHCVLSDCREIDLRGNAFVQVPVCLWQFPRTTRIDLSENPLTDPSKRTLIATRGAPGYIGPDFVCTDAHTEEPTRMRKAEVKLERALRSVFDPDAESRAPMAWHRAIQTMATPEFIAWVTRLSALPAGLRSRIAPKLGTLMARCALSKSLRQLILQTVHDASISCNDRILLSWERVQLARKCHDAVHQKWAPGQLITLARKVFRVEEMMKIAQQKIRHQHLQAERNAEDDDSVDDLQTALAFLSMGHGPLNYDNDTGFGQYIREEISGVSFVDVSRAIRQIKQRENEHFASFLCTWDPWLQLLKRQKTIAFNFIHEDANNDERRERLTQRMTRNALAAGLSGHALDDAVTKGLADAFDRRRIRGLTRLTMELLRELGATPLLKPVWENDQVSLRSKKK